MVTSPLPFPFNCIDYFKAVLKLAKSKEEFPVNLEDVWPLVYTKKSDAVEALRRDFIEKEDFVSLRQNPQPDSQWINPNPKIDYFISVSCLEYIFTLLFRGDLVCQQLSCDTARSVPLFYHI